MALRVKNTLPDTEFPLRLPLTRPSYLGFKNDFELTLFRDKILPFGANVLAPDSFIPQSMLATSPVNVHVKFTDDPSLFLMICP